MPPADSAMRSGRTALTRRRGGQGPPGSRNSASSWCPLTSFVARTRARAAQAAVRLQTDSPSRLVSVDCPATRSPKGLTLSVRHYHGEADRRRTVEADHVRRSAHLGNEIEHQTTNLGAEVRISSGASLPRCAAPGSKMACTAIPNAATGTSWTWRRWSRRGGRRFPISRLESRLRCPKCGSRDVVLLFTIPRETQSARVAKR